MKVLGSKALAVKRQQQPRADMGLRHGSLTRKRNPKDLGGKMDPSTLMPRLWFSQPDRYYLSGIPFDGHAFLRIM